MNGVLVIGGLVLFLSIWTGLMVFIADHAK
jgi:hypothetical protein